MSWVTSRSQYSTRYFYSLVGFPLEEVTLLGLVLGTGEELSSVVLCELGDQYFCSLVGFPLEEVALLGLVLGTGEELSSVVLCELGDLSEDGGTAVAAPRVVEVGPAEMLARLRPEQEQGVFFQIFALRNRRKKSTIKLLSLYSPPRGKRSLKVISFFKRVFDRYGNV